MTAVQAKSELLRYYGARVASIEHRQCRDILAGVNVQFFRDLAEQAGFKLADIVRLFKDSKVVKFFSKFRFSFKAIHDGLKKGYKALKDLAAALKEYADQSGITRWTKAQLDSQRLRDIDEWLKRHPKTSRITGVVVGFMLAYIWFNMTFVGNPAFDFDLSDMIGALGGSYSLSSIFGGASGATLLLLFLTGLAGLTFPWPGSAGVKFVIAVTTTLARKLGKRLRQAGEGLASLADDLLEIVEVLNGEFRHE